MQEVTKLLLCIEDDLEDCNWIEEAITEIQVQLVFVHKSNGKEGMTFLNSQKQFGDFPCLILLDINMPIMDGKQMLAAIKNDPLLKDIPVVVFTTSNSKADQLYCERYGAELITKPQKVPELKRKVQQVVMARCA